MAPDASGKIAIPPTLAQVVGSRGKLLESIYPNLATNFPNVEWLKERAVLAPLNDGVDSLNDLLLTCLPGDAHKHLSVDTVEDDDSGEYPVEFLNACKPSGVASHELHLKVGAPIMLLRNLNAPKLCNGTCLVVRRLQ